MKNIQNITHFKIKGTKYKIQHVFDNNKHYLQIYKKFIFLYIEIKLFSFDDAIQLSHKYNELIQHFSYLEMNLKND
jgi:hypothetical protein